eukprot:3405500-Lingulodinium_polyedra.AAC.1
MPGKKPARVNGAKAVAQQNKAQNSWEKFKLQSSRSYVEDMFDSDPQVLLDVEKFLRSRVWAKPDKKEAAGVE